MAAFNGSASTKNVLKNYSDKCQTIQLRGLYATECGDGKKEPNEKVKLLNGPEKTSSWERKAMTSCAKKEIWKRIGETSWSWLTFGFLLGLCRSHVLSEIAEWKTALRQSKQTCEKNVTDHDFVAVCLSSLNLKILNSWLHARRQKFLRVNFASNKSSLKQLLLVDEADHDFIRWCRQKKSPNAWLHPSTFGQRFAKSFYVHDKW